MAINHETWNPSSGCFKRVLLFLMAILLTTCLAGCGKDKDGECKHDWQPATCVEPETCSKCGETRGEPNGHTYAGEACVGTDTCTVCGAIIPAAGHVWIEATCTEPKTCRKCGETEGAPLGHEIVNGVCTRCGEVLSTVAEQSGHGNKTITDIVLGADFYTLHSTHSGKGSFTITMKDATGAEALLVSTTGAYDGTVLMYGASPVTLSIQASGDWTYQIEKITLGASTSASGTGDGVVGVAEAEAGTYHVTHSGSGLFYVWAFLPGGSMQVVAPTQGAVSTDVELPLTEGTYVIYEVHATGAWTIEKKAG